MADDRPVEDPTETIGRLTTDLEDFKSTVLARLTRRPTGDIEYTLRSTPKANTLFLQGQAVSRTTYAELWAWVQEQGLVTGSLFTAGDGTTTFGLPDLRGRAMVSSGVLGAETFTLGTAGGTSQVTLAIANLPPHNHAVSDHGNHSHPLTGGGGSTNNTGSHAGHNSGSFGIAAGSAGATAANGQTQGGAHSHTVQTEVFCSGTSAGSHSVGNTGGGTAFDNKPPYLVVNVAIWT